MLAGLAGLILVGTAAATGLARASHSGAHALFGSMLTKVEGIKPPGNGPWTTTIGQEGMGGFVAVFAGYLGPPLFGLLGAWLLSRDHPVAVLWLAILMFVGLLVLMQNLRGIFLVVLLGGPLLYVAWSTPVVLQTLVAYVVVWVLLLVGAPKVWPTLSSKARKIDPKAKSKSDHLILREMTYLPQIMWGLLHLLICGAALMLGAWLMLVA